jgi:signal transduction histidine kinase/CheY-like chemotaxis protein
MGYHGLLSWTPIAVLPALAGLLVLLLIVPVWPHRHRPLARSFFVFVSTTAIWALAYAAELCSTDLKTALFWANVEYFGIPATPTSFFALVLLVAGVRRHRRLTLSLLGVHSAVLWFSAWTNDQFHLLRQNLVFEARPGFMAVKFDHGPAYTANVLVSYGCIVATILLLAKMSLSRNALSRKQGQILLLGVLVPVAGNVLRLMGYEPIPGFDQTPLLFVISALTVAYGLFRWSLISVAPIARDQIVENLRDPVVVLGPGGRVVDSNPTACELFGLNQDELARATIDLLAARFPGKDFLTASNNVLQLGERSYFVRRTPLGTAGQTPYGFILQFTDVTDQQTAEAELRVAKELAEQMSAAKSRFVANVSHELRTPLTGVVGLSELLAKTPLNQQQLEYLTGIRQSSQTLLRLINDVLDMSKLEADAMAITLETTDLGELVHSVAQVHRHLAEEKGLRLIVREPSLRGTYVRTDSLRLIQILNNLLGNALKFTAVGEINVGVSQTAPGVFEIVVEDTGIGIPEDRLSTVFEAFEQASETTSRNYGGTGLGLTITRRLVERMDGHIEIFSEVDKGTRMVLSLPLEVVAADDAVASVADVPPGIRVLLAEDNVVNTLVITEQLKEFGCRPYPCGDGFAAVKLFGEMPFDLVLLDIQMPGMDGLEACREIRRQHPETKTLIYALTANAFEDERIRAAEAGMDGFLTKPVERQDLSAALIRAAAR